MTRRTGVEDRIDEVAGEISDNKGGLDEAAASICGGLRRSSTTLSSVPLIRITKKLGFFVHHGLWP